MQPGLCKQAEDLPALPPPCLGLKITGLTLVLAFSLQYKVTAYICLSTL